MEDERSFFGHSASFFRGVADQDADPEGMGTSYAYTNGVEETYDMATVTSSAQHQEQGQALVEPETEASATRQQLEALRSQQQQYHAWLVDYLNQASGYTAADADMGFTSDIPSLLYAIYSASVGRSYLHYLKSAAEAHKELERSIREAETLRQQLSPASAPPVDLPAAHAALEQYITALQACTDALATTMLALQASAYYAAPAWAALPQLQEAAAGLEQRLQQNRYSLYQHMLEDLQQALDAACWPPPLTRSKQHSDGTPPEAEERLSNGIEQPQSFKSFGALHAMLLPRLNGLLACLNRLQMASEHQQFQSLQQQQQQQDSPAVDSHEVQQNTTAAASEHIQEGPLLWSIAQLTSQLQAKLQAHFSPETEAGRLDKPEWLFKTVVGFLQDYAGAMEELQPSITASGLQQHYHACVEFARAVRVVTRAVLRSCRLPALLQAGEQYDYLWLMQVDATLDFEKQVAPFLGALQLGGDGEVPETLAADSCLTAITQEPDFLAAWAAAEQRTAAGQLGTMEVRPSQGGSTVAWGTGPAAGVGQQGWQREFHPPAFAERTADVVAGLVERSRHIPTAQEQRTFLEVAVGPLLDNFESQMMQLLSGSDEYGDGGEAEMMTDSKITAVCACITASRYLHHQLTELLAGPALYRINQEQLQRQAQNGGAAATAGPVSPGLSLGGIATSSIAATPLRIPGRGSSNAMLSDSCFATPSKGAGFGDVVMRHSFTGVSDPQVLVARASSLGAMHREWCLRVARELSKCFGKLAGCYREEVVKAPSYPTHSGPSDSASPQLLPALALLEQRLSLLATYLDGPSFRDIWRAVSVPVNRFMFNHVATEARFTSGGAAQFLADVAALVGIFSPYTHKPAAHFRETLAACRLLSLTDDEAGEVVRRASSLAVASGTGAGSVGAAYKKDPLLLHLGVVCLTPHQVVAVVERRV